MKIIKLTKKNIREVIDKSVNILNKSGALVTPSETQYGLSADPTNTNAVCKIFTLKGRNYGKPLPLVAGSLETVKAYFVLNKQELEVANKFWPGPLGLLLIPKKEALIQKIAKLTLGNKYNESEPSQNKMAIRVTSDKFLAELSNKLGKPIISTSANISGQSACYDLECVLDQFKYRKVQSVLAIDAGVLKPSPASTILDLSGAWPVVIRPGANYQTVEKFLKLSYKYWSKNQAFRPCHATG